MTRARRLLFVDFTCAFVGALFFFLLFDFLVESIGIPERLVRAQLAANVGYGLFGLGLFLSRTNRPSFFWFLTIMNFVYAALCFIASASLAVRIGTVAASVLLAECILIAALAEFERRFWLNREVFERV